MSHRQHGYIILNAIMTTGIKITDYKTYAHMHFISAHYGIIIILAAITAKTGNSSVQLMILQQHTKQ